MLVYNNGHSAMGVNSLYVRLVYTDSQHTAELPLDLLRHGTAMNFGIPFDNLIVREF